MAGLDEDQYEEEVSYGEEEGDSTDDEENPEDDQHDQHSPAGESKDQTESVDGASATTSLEQTRAQLLAKLAELDQMIPLAVSSQQAAKSKPTAAPVSGCPYRFKGGRRINELCGVIPRSGSGFCSQHKNVMRPQAARQVKYQSVAEPAAAKPQRIRTRASREKMIDSMQAFQAIIDEVLGAQRPSRGSRSHFKEVAGSHKAAEPVSSDESEPVASASASSTPKAKAKPKAKNEKSKTKSKSEKVEVPSDSTQRERLSASTHPAPPGGPSLAEAPAKTVTRALW